MIETNGKEGKGKRLKWKFFEEDLTRKPSILDSKLKRRTKNFTEFLVKNLKSARMESRRCRNQIYVQNKNQSNFFFLLFVFCFLG